MNSLGQHITPVDFESLYTQLREKEGRIHADEEVAQLPVVSATHPHYKEWQVRKESSQKLVSWLRKKKKPLDMLEIGCGNGWLSHKLSIIPHSMVIGTDINFSEIQQAARVFQHAPNLHFIYTYGEPGIFKEKRFDIVVFAAAIQYFESFPETIQNALQWLKQDGEIHILDSPFYSAMEVSPARQRSRDYYESSGFPGMIDYYFHHSFEELEKFKYEILYQPGMLMRRLAGNKNPFPWIAIRSS